MTKRDEERKREKEEAKREREQKESIHEIEQKQKILERSSSKFPVVIFFTTSFV